MIAPAESGGKHGLVGLDGVSRASESSPSQFDSRLYSVSCILSPVFPPPPDGLSAGFGEAGWLLLLSTDY